MSLDLDLFNLPVAEVRLYFAPQAIFEGNLLACSQGKTYKPEMEEVQSWNFIFMHYKSVYEVISHANSEDAKTMRSPFAGDVIRVQQGEFTKHWVLAPGGGFWALDPTPDRYQIMFRFWDDAKAVDVTRVLATVAKSYRCTLEPETCHTSERLYSVVLPNKVTALDCMEQVQALYPTMIITDNWEHGIMQRLPLMDEEDAVAEAALASLQRIAKGDGLLQLLAADQDFELVYASECA
jgi:hypothetical protein